MNLFRREGTPIAVLLAGFTLWSVVFVALYAAQATGCRLGWHGVELFGAFTLQRAVLAVMFLAAIGAHAALYWAIRACIVSERWSTFAGEAGRALSLAAAGASLFCFAGVLWLTTC